MLGALRDSFSYSGDLGRKDNVTSLSFGKRLVRHLPNARLVIINNCGHSPHMECPDQITSFRMRPLLAITWQRSNLPRNSVVCRLLGALEKRNKYRRANASGEGHVTDMRAS